MTQLLRQIYQTHDSSWGQWWEWSDQKSGGEKEQQKNSPCIYDRTDWLLQSQITERKNVFKKIFLQPFIER